MKTHPLLVFNTYRINNTCVDTDKSLTFAKEFYRMDRALSLAQAMIWDDKDYPGIHGTFAPVWYRQKMYMLTANHCVLKQELSNLSYIVDYSAKNSLIFNQIDLSNDDSESEDYALIPVKDNGMSLAERASWAFDLERDCLSYHEPAIADVAFRGAPSKINGVDYDEKK